MKDKKLNTYAVESNGEVVTINVIETEKGVVVDIDGKTMDIFINGENFYSKYDKEEYKYIPVQLRDFVNRRLPDYSDIEKEKSCIKCDLNIEGKDYFTKISTQRAKDNTITFTDALTDYELVKDELDIELSDAIDKYNKLLNGIKSFGYKLELSHGGNDNYQWYSLIIPINKFDENKVIECVKLWNEYNNYLDAFYKK